MPNYQKKLPCQEVPPFPKPSQKPSLPPSFKVMDREQSKLDTKSALKEADANEFLISFLRCGRLDDKEGRTPLIPTWHGTHAPISKTNVPMMRVGFGVMIPHPINQYATVRKSLHNFQSIRRQVCPDQTVLPIFTDEGFFHTAADILMAEPDEFDDLHNMMGNFHWVKDGLKCAGRYLRGSGLDDALTETDVFGKLVLNQALDLGYYVRSFYCALLVSDLASTLSYAAF